MTSIDQRRPGEKSGKNKKKRNKKAEQQSPKPDQAPAAKPAPVAAAMTPKAPEEAIENVAAVEAKPAERVENVAAVEAAPAEPVARVAALEVAPAEPAERGAALEAAPAELAARVASFRERMASVTPPADIAPSKPPAPADIAKPVPSPAVAPAAGIQALANAYRDYTRKSLADAQSFAEKLSAARTFDKAVEAQTEFAKKACETFAADSRKISELHRQLFWQAFTLPGWPLRRTPR